MAKWSRTKSKSASKLISKEFNQDESHDLVEETIRKERTQGTIFKERTKEAKFSPETITKTTNYREFILTCLFI